MAKQELLATIRDRYQESSKKEKGRILDEFIAVTGHHRKYGIRLLAQTGYDAGRSPVVKGRRIYDEAVRESVIVIWEAADRICGKRLKAALPNLVESMERHGHLDLDPQVRRRLLAASASTLDRLLKPIRATAGSRRKRRKRPSMGGQVPVRTFADWNKPPPGFLEIAFVVHCGGPLSGSFIHSLVATDVCTGSIQRTAGGRGSSGYQSLRRKSHLRAGWSGLVGIGTETAHRACTRLTRFLASAAGLGRWMVRWLDWGDKLPASQAKARA